jgi:hypothetical protein
MHTSILPFFDMPQWQVLVEILWRRRAAFRSFDSVVIGKNEQSLVKRWKPGGSRFPALFSGALCTSGGGASRNQ